MNVRQAHVSSRMQKSVVFVIQPHLMENCGPKIIDITRVFRGTVA